jgi:hypothetical protein
MGPPKLERYNQAIWAIIGTGVVVMVLTIVDAPRFKRAKAENFGTSPNTNFDEKHNIIELKEYILSVTKD